MWVKLCVFCISSLGLSSGQSSESSIICCWRSSSTHYIIVITVNTQDIVCVALVDTNTILLIWVYLIATTYHLSTNYFSEWLPLFNAINKSCSSCWMQFFSLLSSSLLMTRQFNNCFLPPLLVLLAISYILCSGTSTCILITGLT